jgi:hypothetical protein
MKRLALAIVVATALSGCQHSGQQAIDPFWGHTTVPPPPTGSIGTPMIDLGCQQPLQSQPIITPGTPMVAPPLSNGALQPTPQPNLLPAPISPAPGAAGTVAPTPATPVPPASGVPYGNGAPAGTSPPAGYPTPGRPPLSGYSNPDLPSSGSSASPAVTMPGAAPAAPYPASSAPPTVPGGLAPPPSGAAPIGPPPGPSAPMGPVKPPPPSGLPPAGGRSA